MKDGRKKGWNEGGKERGDGKRKDEGETKEINKKTYEKMKCMN